MVLRLERRPDRTPARLGISAAQDIARALTDHPGIYRQAYGTEEEPGTRIPAMLEHFPGNDPGSNGRAAPFTPAKETDPWHK
ncbi:MAG: DUF2274 domain-containing protein [Hyphomonas sp.]